MSVELKSYSFYEIERMDVILSNKSMFKSKILMSAFIERVRSFFVLILFMFEELSDDDQLVALEDSDAFDFCPDDDRLDAKENH